MKKYLEKKLTSNSISSLLTYLPEKLNLEELISVFKKDLDEIKKVNWGEEYNEIKMSFEEEYGYYDSHDFNIIYWGYRYETDEEYNKRLEEEQKRQQAAKKAAITKKEAIAKREKTLLKKLLEKYKNVNI